MQWTCLLSFVNIICRALLTLSSLNALYLLSNYSHRAIFMTRVLEHLQHFIASIDQTSKFKTNIIKVKQAIYLHFMVLLSKFEAPIKYSYNKENTWQLPHGRINHPTTLLSRSRVIFAHTLLCTPCISKIQQPRSNSNSKDNPKRGLEINNRNKEVEYYLLHHCSTRGRCEYISSDISYTNNKGGAAHCVLLQFFKDVSRTTCQYNRCTQIIQTLLCRGERAAPL